MIFRHSALACQASFVLKYSYKEKSLHIQNAYIEHNYLMTPETFSQEYEVKRLSKSERKSLEI